MSNTEEWEEVVVPQGNFLTWGPPGHEVTGYVVDYSETGGSDFDGEPCPLVVLELTKETTSYRTKGDVKVDVGEFLSVTCSQANLKNGVRAAALERGYLVKIRREEDYKTAKGEGKTFKIFVHRAKRAAVSSNDLV